MKMNQRIDEDFNFFYQNLNSDVWFFSHQNDLFYKNNNKINVITLAT